MKYSIIKYFVFAFCSFLFMEELDCQKDTLVGRIKSIREYVTFIDSNRQNLKLWSIEEDYGHYGFWSKEFTLDRFNTWWFHTPFVHYLNYNKAFNNSNLPIREVWFYKDADTVRIYDYIYDDNHNLIQEREDYTFDDPSYTIHNYDQDNRIVTTIHFSAIDSLFRLPSYYYIIYEYQNDKIVTQKSFDSNGESTTTFFEYDDKNQKSKVYVHSPYKLIQKNEQTRSLVRESNGKKFLSREYFYTLDEMKCPPNPKR